MYICNMRNANDNTMEIKFTNTVEHRDGTIINVKSFETRKEAKKEARKTMKEYNMINHAGHKVNYTEYTELYTNY